MKSSSVGGLALLLWSTSLLSQPNTTSGSVTLCIRNCAQCKRLFGAYFEGQRCAEACIQFEGKMTPDCTDHDSVAPFLNKLE